MVRRSIPHGFIPRRAFLGIPGHWGSGGFAPALDHHGDRGEDQRVLQRQQNPSRQSIANGSRAATGSANNRCRQQPTSRTGTGSATSYYCSRFLHRSSASGYDDLLGSKDCAE